MDPSRLCTSGIGIKGIEKMGGAVGAMCIRMVVARNEENIGERARTDGRNIDLGNERGISGEPVTILAIENDGMAGTGSATETETEIASGTINAGRKTP